MFFSLSLSNQIANSFHFSLSFLFFLIFLFCFVIKNGSNLDHYQFWIWSFDLFFFLSHTVDDDGLYTKIDSYYHMSLFFIINYGRKVLFFFYIAFFQIFFHDNLQSDHHHMIVMMFGSLARNHLEIFFCSF